ncbi:diguanylate cyclase domain-containing protein [Notoacmeibacter sp. MSK16QG-6]|uniref:sensor domain-containing diguanylate cyclase n=1 Tax=Notoacmeibacter sp. MSK16QG-6 TaxID=2957982 RepID=UPI0020A081E3|nr:diguanylate cyclase [Notoacmeibacter sp. MSK16QG-6]MCP1199620.1 diguanylate cyclase [Notoacmeibacter sp. MSK16QG-6]
MIDIEMLGVPASLVEVQDDGMVRYVGLNSLVEQMLGIDEKNFIGKTPLEAWPGQAGEQISSKYKTCLSGGKMTTFTDEREGEEASTFLNITLTPLRQPGSESVSHVVTVFQDVTDVMRQKRALREANARLELAIDVIDGAFWHLDIASGEFTASKGLAMLADSDPSKPFSGEQWMALIHESDGCAAGLETLMSGEVGTMTTYYRITTLTGETRWMRCRRKSVVDETGKVVAVCGVTVDITNEKLREHELEQKSQRDPLTNLCNTRAFDAKLERLAREPDGKPFSVAIIDLNDFKPINDNYGHLVGDAVLKEFARRLQDSCRGTDMACRVGGDEFAIVLPGSDKEQAAGVAQRLLRSLGRPFVHEGRTIQMSASIGYAEYGDFDDVLGMLQAADTMMYEQKRKKPDSSPYGLLKLTA